MFIIASLKYKCMYYMYFGKLKPISVVSLLLLFIIVHKLCSYFKPLAEMRTICIMILVLHNKGPLYTFN